MSAIFGILRFDGGNVSPRDLERMAEAMPLRGPDGRDFIADGPVGLGHCLMRVNAEDRFEAQPLYDRETEVTLVADCRIDNREELAQIFGWSNGDCRDKPDSAFILKAYRVWGEDCAEHLLGDFTFAVWDGRRRSLMLARDHMGLRYLHYHLAKTFIAFSTEIWPLWTLVDVPRELNARHIAERLLMDEIADPDVTEFKGIFSILGAEMLLVSLDGSVARRRFWEPGADPRHEKRDEAYYLDAYRHVLSEAVACRLRRTIAPAGLFLSGGFDSAAISALAGPVVTAQNRKLVAVASVLSKGAQGEHRAREWVDICARYMPHLDVRHVTHGDADILSGMEASFQATGRRHSPNRHVNDPLFAEVARSGARLLMDGYGGDYTLNARGYGALAHFLLTGDLSRFVTEFWAVRRLRQQGIFRTFISEVAKPCAPASLQEMWLRYRTDLPLRGPTLPLSRRIIEGRGRGARPRFGMRRPGRIAQLRAVRGVWNSGQQASAAAGAAHGLVFAQPFHDKRVVELGLALPERLYMKDGQTRYLAKTALRHDYPPEFQQRLPGNDSTGPEFMKMARKIEQDVRAEMMRMQKDTHLSDLFDFHRMQDMLVNRGRSEAAREINTRKAMLAFLSARYIEWFQRDNAS